MTVNNTPNALSGLEIFKGLRVTDVCDGMDALGLQDIGIVSHDIRPVWRDIEKFTHRVYGVAHTIRFLPTQRGVPTQTPDEFFNWMANWYKEFAQGPFAKDIVAGEIIMIDSDNCGTVGVTGSENTQSWLNAGAVGCVTNGGARDTDEQIKQRIPLYSRYISNTIRPGRVELDAIQVPINVGGARVNPGDVVVADGDGVVVVPAAVALDVAKYARKVANEDKASRRELYRQAGLEPDFTVL